MHNNIRDIIYPVHTFSELKMKLELAGIDTKNLDEREFICCHPDDWKWGIYCNDMDMCVLSGRDVGCVNNFSSVPHSSSIR